MQKFKKNALDYFERHPSSNECHITSDGRVFHTNGSAEGFAGTLDDKNIESYSRKVLLKESELENSNTADNVAKLQELEKLDYKQIKALADHFKLETADQKKETLFDALNEFKNSVNQ